MKSLSAIVRTEWLLLFREGWPGWMGALYTLLFLIALSVGIAWRAQWSDAVQEVRNTQAKLWHALYHDLPLYRAGKLINASYAEGINVKQQKVYPDDPYIVGFYGKVAAILTPGPLTELAVGQSDLYPPVYLLSTRQVKDTVLNAETGEAINPYHLLLGRFDPAFVIIFLLPIVVIAISYDVTSTDRQSGTLALLLSNPVASQKVVWVKLVARIAPLLGLTLVAGVVGHTITATPGPYALNALLLWCLLVSAYTAFWMVLAFLVDRKKWSSATNALVLCLSWILFVPVLPAAIQQAAEALYPVPSRSVMAEEIRWGNVQTEKQENQESLLRDLLAMQWPGLPGKPIELYSRLPHVGSDQDNRQELVRLFALRYAEDQSNLRISARIDDATRRQEQFVQTLSFCSPALLMKYLLDRVAGTGAERFRHFTHDVAVYHTDLRMFYIRYLLTNIPMTEADFHLRPEFSQSRP